MPKRSHKKQRETGLLVCPYCGSENSIVLKMWPWPAYAFVNDCEVCCKPMVIQVRKVNAAYETEARAE